MTSIFFRISKSWIGVFLTVCPLLFIISLSLHFSNNCSQYDEWWGHQVSEYSSSDDINAQIEYISELIQSSHVKEDITYMEETIDILEYLNKEGIKYDDVQEGGFLIQNNREQRSYSFQMIEYVLVFQLFLSIFTLFVVNNLGKMNGAFVIAYLMQGRKRCFWEEGLSYLLIMMYCLIPQVTYISLTRKMVPNRHGTLLFYNKGDIKLMSSEKEYIWLLISLFVTLISIYIFHFILSELFNNAVLFFFSSAIVNILSILMSSASKDNFISVIGISLSSIYEYGITVETYAFTKTAIFAILLAAVYGCYRLNLKKKIRTEYS